MSSLLPDRLRNWKAVVRRSPGGTRAVQAIVFLAGLLFILLGVALVALPGPLTIPPILVGLYIWATEFPWADRLLDRAKRQAQEAWDQARRRPVTTAVVTGGGLVAAGVVIWLALRYDLAQRLQDLVGLG